MKFGVFSDLHLHNHAPFAEPLGMGFNSRAGWCLDVLYQIRDLSRDLDFLLFCGDFFETREYIGVPLLQAAREVLEEFPCPIYAIGGNHDAVSNDPDSPNAISLLYGDGVIKPPVRINDDTMIVGYNFNVPMSRWQESLPEGNHILMLHEHFVGTKNVITGFEFESGLNMNKVLEYMDRNHIKVCFCGDIHFREELVEDRLWYVGAPLQDRFGDPQDKGMLFVEDWQVEFIPLKAPKFISCTLEEYMEKHSNDDFNYFRIEVGDKEDEKLLKDVVGSNVKLSLPKKSLTKKEKRSSIVAGSSIDELVETWAKEKADKATSKPILKLGKDIIRKVKEK